MIPQVQVGAQPPWGAWLRMSRGGSTRTHVCTNTQRRDELLLGTQLGQVYTRGDRTSWMERWADPHTAPRRGLLPLTAGAVLAPQNPWGHTLSWSQPTHSWVTASCDPRKGHSLY